MNSRSSRQLDTLGFEKLAWTLFEYTAADQMFVYRRYLISRIAELLEKYHKDVLIDYY